MTKKNPIGPLKLASFGKKIGSPSPSYPLTSTISDSSSLLIMSSSHLIHDDGKAEKYSNMLEKLSNTPQWTRENEQVRLSCSFRGT